MMMSTLAWLSAGWVGWRTDAAANIHAYGVVVPQPASASVLCCAPPPPRPKPLPPPLFPKRNKTPPLPGPSAGCQGRGRAGLCLGAAHGGAWVGGPSHVLRGGAGVVGGRRGPAGMLAPRRAACCAGPPSPAAARGAPHGSVPWLRVPLPLPRPAINPPPLPSLQAQLVQKLTGRLDGVLELRLQVGGGGGAGPLAALTGWLAGCLCSTWQGAAAAAAASTSPFQYCSAWTRG